MSLGQLLGWLEGSDWPGKRLCTMSEFNKCRGLPSVALAPVCAPRSDPPPLAHTRAHAPGHTLIRPGFAATCCLEKLIYSHTN